MPKLSVLPAAYLLAFALVPGLALASPAAGSDQPPISLELVFERLGELDGGADVAAALGALTYDASLGDSWRLSTNLLWPVGESLSESLGDIGTVSNIDAPNGPRVQELWLERDLGVSGSARFGWLAADTELWSTDSGGLFLHSVFGAPAVLSTNASAPPIYPSASLGLRFEHRWATGRWRVAALDAHAGDPTDSRGLDLELDDALIAFELELGPEAATAPRLELSVGLHRDPSHYHTSTFVLASAEIPLGAGTILFARLGTAGGVDRTTSHTIEAGLTWALGPGTVGVAGAELEFHRVGAASVHRHHERILEATYRLPIGANLVVQPALQRVVTPARPDAAWVLGLRAVINP